MFAEFVALGPWAVGRRDVTNVWTNFGGHGVFCTEVKESIYHYAILDFLSTWDQVLISLNLKSDLCYTDNSHF